MSRRALLKRLERTLTDQNLPFYILSAVAILTMPASWFIPVFAAVVVAAGCSYVRHNPTLLSQPKQVLADPAAKRLCIYLCAWACWGLLRGTLKPGFFGQFGPETGAMLTMSVAAFSTYSLVFWQAVRALARTPGQRLQKWVNSTFAGFMSALVCSTYLIVCWPSVGLGKWVSGWLLSSFRDASMEMDNFTVGTMSIFTGPGQPPVVVSTPPPAEQFALAVHVLLGLAMIALLWRPAASLAGFLTVFAKQLNGKSNAALSVSDKFLRCLRAPITTLKMKERHPFVKNAGATLCWLAFCYMVLFLLVGFSDGPLGAAIKSWLDASIADAHFGMIWGASANPKLRIFCAALVALFGMIPLAVTGAVFLPHRGRRVIELTPDGMFFPDGPFGALRWQPLRLWADVARVDLRRPKKTSKANDRNTKLIVSFHSGGKIELSVAQLGRAGVETLLSSIDTNATDCTISDAVVSLRTEIRQTAASAQKAGQLDTQKTEQFQSTVFVPHHPGEWLPGGGARVVRLLATRPLSCVYLVRLETGKLGIAKQFFFAEDNEQSQALRKCFEREYELLKQLDHPAISKVLEVFHHEQCTYLMVEHADGADLRALVADLGPRSETSVIDWALQLCDILTYLHDQDPPVVHRDLTPDNIIVGDDGTLRIIDFGAAHQFLEGITGTIIGKQCYVSPEQLRGQAGPRSDIYSFGCTLYFLLTGCEPVALMPCHPSTKTDVSSQLDELILSCTDFDESLRPASFVELKTRLLAIKEMNESIESNESNERIVLTLPTREKTCV